MARCGNDCCSPPDVRKQTFQFLVIVALRCLFDQLLAQQQPTTITQASFAVSGSKCSSTKLENKVMLSLIAALEWITYDSALQHGDRVQLCAREAEPNSIVAADRRF
jgi:hypothetical protein